MSSNTVNLVGHFVNLSTGATVTKEFDRVNHFVDRIETRMPHEEAALASCAEIDESQLVFENVRYDELVVTHADNDEIHIVFRQSGDKDEAGINLCADKIVFSGDNSYTIQHTDPELADSLIEINDNDDHVYEGKTYEFASFYPFDVSMQADPATEAISA